MVTINIPRRLVKDGTRGVKSVTYQPFGNLPRRVTMDNGDYAHSVYMPDGTLMARQFCTKAVRTVIKVTADGDTIVKTYPYNKVVTRSYIGQFEKSPEGLIYHSTAGYYDFARHQHYWYLLDRLGSTAAVVDSNGTLLQTTAYYPSGTPHQLAASAIATPVDAATDRLHIGNRWLSHSGLNWYDNTARMHDPLLMRFAVPDPLWADYPGLSPWSHCAANPLNLIDPSGAEWADLQDVARLQKDIRERIKTLEEENAKNQGKVSEMRSNGKDVSGIERTIKDNSEMLISLQQTLSDIDLLGKDKSRLFSFGNTFGDGTNIVAKTGNVTKGENTYLGVKIYASTTAERIHEITHVRQFLTTRDFRFDSEGNLGYRAKKEDEYYDKFGDKEVEAYKAQYSFRPSSYPGQANRVSDINISSVGKIKKTNGQLLYPWIPAKCKSYKP